MTTSVRALALAATLMLGALPGLAQRAALAEVRADRTNLRAQPSLDSEVLASLRRGEILSVLGEETSPGDRELWSRVALPSSVTVWVHSPGVDKAGLVKNEKIYFRAGPGKNYSVLGSLRRGSSVTILREFDGWLQISPPPGAVAFVASRLLASPGSGAPSQALAAPAPPPGPRSSNAPPVAPRTARSAPPSGINAVPPPGSAPPVRPTHSPTAADADAVNRAPDTAASRPAANIAPRTLPPTPSTAPAAAPQNPQNVSVQAPVIPPPRTEAPAPAPIAPPPSDEVAASPDPDPATASRPALRGSPRDIASRSMAAPREHPLLATDPDPGRPKPEETQVAARRVTREGTVRRTLSPHAPSNYELRDGFYGEGVLDYLYIEPQDDLKKFLGQRVRVEGEEYRDSRWRTPVLKIQSVELAP